MSSVGPPLRLPSLSLWPVEEDVSRHVTLLGGRVTLLGGCVTLLNSHVTLVGGHMT